MEELLKQVLLEIKKNTAWQEINATESLNIAQTALYMGVTESRVYHLINDGQIPYYKRKNSNKVYIDKRDIDRFRLWDRRKSQAEIDQMAEQYCTNKKKPIL